MNGNFIGQLLRLITQAVLAQWSRAAANIARHIIGHRLCGKFDLVDTMNHTPQILFDHAVKLNTLPSRDADCAVPQFVGDIKFTQKLYRRDFSAWNTIANHERKRFVQSRFSSQFPQVAIILLKLPNMLNPCRMD